MEVKIIEDTKNKLVFDIEGDSNSLTGALKKELWNDDKVKASGYNISHPLINVPRFVLETDGTEPRKILKDAIKRLQKNIEKARDGLKEVK